jgi:hypothetical protein
VISFFYKQLEKNKSKNQSLMTRMVFGHMKSLICMNTTTKKRSNAAKIGWLRHDLAALKRSYASAKGWDTRRHG